MFEEIFNQQRFERCSKIAHSIFDKQKAGQPLRYKVEATEPLHGLQLQELAGKYFRVGYGGDQVTELPFLDMLVTLSYLRAILEGHKRFRETGQKTMEAKLAVQTAFSAEEAAEILTQFCIRTPYDPSDQLQIVVQRKSDPDIETAP